jgi:hypothetical protein
MIGNLDLNDSKQKRLASFAARIVELLEKPAVQNNKPFVSVIDDLLGAVYALVAARQERFHGKLGESQFSPILDRAKLIATGKPKTSGNWMAGFLSFAKIATTGRSCRRSYVIDGTRVSAVACLSRRRRPFARCTARVRPPVPDVFAPAGLTVQGSKNVYPCCALAVTARLRRNTLRDCSPQAARRSYR